MIHLITGDGKGKTTAAAGQAIRAAGHGWRVLFVQFLKDGSSGEIRILRNTEGITVRVPAVKAGFTFRMTEEEFAEAAEANGKLLSSVKESGADLIVLDEVLHLLKTGMIRREELEEVLDAGSGRGAEMVLTGREVPEWLRERADYLSVIRKEKHPYDRGSGARRGVEW